MKDKQLFTMLMAPVERAALDNISKLEGGIKSAETVRILIREGLAARGLPPVGNYVPNGRYNEKHLQAA
jgi:hypothetical protein